LVQPLPQTLYRGGPVREGGETFFLQESIILIENVNFWFASPPSRLTISAREFICNLKLRTRTAPGVVVSSYDEPYRRTLWRCVSFFASKSCTRTVRPSSAGNKPVTSLGVSPASSIAVKRGSSIPETTKAPQIILFGRRKSFRAPLEQVLFYLALEKDEDSETFLRTFSQLRPFEGISGTNSSS
jgi:hypothetical protein